MQSEASGLNRRSIRRVRPDDRAKAASEGRLDVDDTLLLGHDHRQLGACEFQLDLDFAALVAVHGVSQFGSQFFNVLFQKHRRRLLDVCERRRARSWGRGGVKDRASDRRSRRVGEPNLLERRVPERRQNWGHRSSLRPACRHGILRRTEQTFPLRIAPEPEDGLDARLGVTDTVNNCGDPGLSAAFATVCR
ncbi:hypothetical protein BLX90_24070 (plasmid) [Rhizobium sp. Y9]|nr:hypothetical protein BLX90_24070 [Rhizobium sp. Y9]